MAEPTRLRAIDRWLAAQSQAVAPNTVCRFDALIYKARSWPSAWRVLLKAAVMALGENTRCIVTSLPGLDAGRLYEDIDCARGQAEHYINHLKDDVAVAYKNKIVLHLASACPDKHLLQTLTAPLYLPTPATTFNSA